MISVTVGNDEINLRSTEFLCPLSFHGPGTGFSGGTLGTGSKTASVRVPNRGGSKRLSVGRRPLGILFPSGQVLLP